MPQTSLRTLHVDTERPWRGGEQQVVYLTTGLIERGHLAELACRRGSALAERARAAGVPTFEMTVRGEVDPITVVRLARLIAKGRYDIVHSHTSHAHTLAGLATKLLARRPVHIVARRVDFHTAKGPFGRWKYRRLADHYIAVSNAVRNIMIGDGIPDARISVVNSCVDLARFDRIDVGDLRGELGLPGDAVLIVCAAYLVEHKAQKYLVAAMPDVLRAVPAAYCLLVGEGALRPQLETQVAGLGLHDRVRFLGFRSDALRFIKGADVSVMSSQEDGLGNSVQETLALGRPLVATDAGGIPEMVENGVNGIVVPKRDPAALAAGIVRMLTHPDEAARYASAGPRVIAERFTRPRMVERTLAVYRELLGRTA